MREVLTETTDERLAEAVKNNLYGFFRAMKGSAEAEFSEGADAVRWYTAIAHPWFRGVLSTAAPGPGTERTIREALEAFGGRGVQAFTWWVTPEHEGADWASVLEPHGFGYTAEPPGMAVELAALEGPSALPEGLEMQVVDDEATLGMWARVFAAGYGLPESWAEPYGRLMDSLGLGLPFRHTLALLDGEPVAASTLYLDAGVAGIYSVATVEAARRRGIGAAVTLAPLREAQAMGYRVGILQSSAMGYGVYERMGFRKVCDVGHYYWSA